MFKRIFSFALVIIMCLGLAACGNEKVIESDVEIADNTQESTEVTEEVSADSAEEAGALSEPVMEWWELYNPNGYDTITAVITNPNSVAIDVDYTLVFYKDGAEVSRIEYCSNFSILPGGNGIIWMNAEVPAAADADDVKMEDVYVYESAYPPINGSYEYAGIVDGYACYNFTFESAPTLATVWFVRYNDSNGNKQLDKGEIVVTSWDSIMEQSGTASFDTAVYAYTDCDVYFNAY